MRLVGNCCPNKKFIFIKNHRSKHFGGLYHIVVSIPGCDPGHPSSILQCEILGTAKRFFWLMRKREERKGRRGEEREDREEEERRERKKGEQKSAKFFCRRRIMGKGPHHSSRNRSVHTRSSIDAKGIEIKGGKLGLCLSHLMTPSYLFFF